MSIIFDDILGKWKGASIDPNRKVVPQWYNKTMCLNRPKPDFLKFFHNSKSVSSCIKQESANPMASPVLSCSNPYSNWSFKAERCFALLKVLIREGLDKRLIGYKRRQEALLHKPQAVTHLIDHVLQAGIVADYLLMDSWVTHMPLVQKILDRGLHGIGRVKDIEQRYLYRGKMLNVSELYTTIPKRGNSRWRYYLFLLSSRASRKKRPLFSAQSIPAQVEISPQPEV